jgi:redox-sensitive bicupin YhaK (pirin superfamily)
MRFQPSAGRGHADLGWLDSRHTFCFGDWYHPDWRGFRSLLVLNDDRVQAGTGFGTHPHREMEILSWVLDGRLEHVDSTGAREVLGPGCLQRMSAGTGIRHSEQAVGERPTRFLQLWIRPVRAGLPPSWSSATIADQALRGGFALVASGEGGDGSGQRLAAAADLRVARLAPGETVPLAPRRAHLWLQIACGSVRHQAQTLGEGDGLGLEYAEAGTLTAVDAAEVVAVDLD